MENVYYIPLDLIQANPYQTRGQEDPEHVKRLALLIAQQGLLQIPSGRPMKRGAVISMMDAALCQKLGSQIAFGHSRLAAFRMLHDIQLLRSKSADQQIVSEDPVYNAVIEAALVALDGGKSWAMMPVNLRDMTDEEMFASACAENVHQDISVMDKARAMLRWRTEFGKTSKDIGAIFGEAESTVRNTMRLIDLPEQAQDALAAGQLTQNAARRLLSVQEVLAPEAVASLAMDLASGEYNKPEQVENRVYSQIVNDKRTKNMYSSWEEEKQLAGDGMWPLAWVPEMPANSLPRRAEVEKMLPDPAQASDLKNAILDSIRYHGPGFDDSVKKAMDALQNPIVKAAVEHLLNPPACTKCQFFLRFKGSGFCSRRACWEHKRELWYSAELQRISVEMSIPIYNPDVDGDVFEPIDRWSKAAEERFKEMINQKSAYLRVRIQDEHGYYTHPITNHHFVQIVSVSDESRARMRQAKTEVEREKAREIQERNDNERIWAMREKTSKYLEVAAVAFGERLFAKASTGQLRVFTRVYTQQRMDEARDQQMRTRMGYMLVIRLVDRDISSQGPVAAAEYLAGVATEVGINLPEDWAEIARRFQDDETVSTETPEPEVE